MKRKKRRLREDKRQMHETIAPGFNVTALRGEVIPGHLASIDGVLYLGPTSERATGPYGIFRSRCDR